MGGNIVYQKRIIGFAIVLVVLLLLLIVLPFAGRTYVPKIIKGEGLSQECADAIISVEQGYYNSHLPLPATKIEILENSESYILYRVYYFPFISIERSCTREENGNWIFNLERPLF